ncbi:hypothetical protein BHE74_00012888 [Ensete ventricosum]|nr:hypothetical protein GW17_00014800 [Ensete ventricosum]RWW78861.1 hypothetical protein BHE74_00012888 [Ensete ventricosum]RZS05034.1 hypothetical protein BHM03_00035463 [Ensete ventricosum]
MVFFLKVAEGDNDRRARDEIALGWIPAESGCRGNIAACLVGDEFELGTKATRHILARSIITTFLSLEMERG